MPDSNQANIVPSGSPYNVPTPTNSGGYPVNAYNENVGITGNDIPSGLDTGRGLALEYGHPVIEPRDIDDNAFDFGSSVMLDPPPLTNPYDMALGSKDRMDDMADRVRKIVNSTYRQDMMARSPMDILTFSGVRDPKFDARGDRISLDETHYKLSDGRWVRRYDNFIQGTDNEDRLARQQSRGQKWGRGLQKFFGKTLLYGLGGVVQPFYGIAAGVTEGKWSSVFDNDFTKWLDDIDKRMDYSLAHYYKREERDLNFFQSMGTANFWTNDFLSGLAFTAGAMLSSAVFAGAGVMNVARSAARAGAFLSGMGKVGRVAGQSARMTGVGARLVGARGLAANTSKRAIRQYMRGAARGGALGKAMDVGTFLATSTAWEASVEARSMLMEAEDNYIRSFENFYGRRPTYEELAKFRSDNAAAANGVFAANIAILSLSNISLFGKMFNIDLGLDKYIQRNVFGRRMIRNADGALSAKKRGKLNAVANVVYNVGKRPFMEGFFEEGLQGVSSKTADDWIKSRYDPNSLEKNKSFFDSLYQGFADTYGTAEGMKEVGIGALIGGFIGSFDGGGFLGLSERGRELARQDKAIETYNESRKKLTDAAIKNMKASIALNGQISNLSVEESNDDGAVDENGKKVAKKGVDMAGREGDHKTYDDAIYGHLKAADELGMLDEEAATFDRVIDGIPDADIVSVENMSPDDVAKYKSGLKDRFREKLDNYRIAKSLANELTEGMSDNLFRDHIMNTVYNGIDSRSEMERIANEVARMAGNGDVSKALLDFSTLDKETFEIYKELEALNTQITDLGNQIGALEVAAASTPMTNDQLKGKRDPLERKRAELSRRYEELQTRTRELSTIKMNKDLLNGAMSLDDYRRDMPTNDDLIRSISIVRDLERAIKAKGDNATSADSRLAELLYDFRANAVAYKNISEFMGRMRDPRFIAAQEHGFSGMIQMAFNQVYEEDDKALDFRNTENPDVQEILRNDEAIDNAVKEGKLDTNEGFMYKTYNHMIARMQLPDYNAVSKDDVVEREENDGQVDITSVIVKKVFGDDEFLSPNERDIYESNQEFVERYVDKIGKNPLSHLEALKTHLDGIKNDVSQKSIIERNIESIKEGVDESNRQSVDDDIDKLNDMLKNGVDRSSKEYTDVRERLLGVNNLLPSYVEQLYDMSHDNGGKLPDVDINQSTSRGGDMDVVTQDGTPLGSQNPCMVVVKLVKRMGGQEFLSVSGRRIDRFLEDVGITRPREVDINQVDSVTTSSGWTIKRSVNANDTVSYNISNGVLSFNIITGLDHARFLIPTSDVEAFEEATGIIVSQKFGLLNDSGWVMAYYSDGTGLIPYETGNTYGFREDEVINQDAAAEVTDGRGVKKANRPDPTKLKFRVQLNDAYTKPLYEAYRAAIASGNQEEIDKAKRALISGMVIQIYDDVDGGRFVGVVRSLGSEEKDTSNMSKFRLGVFNQVIDENGEKRNGNDIHMISGYEGKVNRVVPGKPNLNITRDADGNFHVEQVEFDDNTANDKYISNIGYAEVIDDGKGKRFSYRYKVRKDYKLGENTNTDFMPRTRGLKVGDRIPFVIIKRPSGHYYIYPVSLKGDRSDIDTYLNGVNAAVLRNASIEAVDDRLIGLIDELNALIKRSTLDYKTNFVNPGMSVEAIRIAIDNALENLRHADIMPDLSRWGDGSGEAGMYDMLKGEATINIKLNGDPFIGPKFQFSVKGAVPTPANTQMSNAQQTNQVGNGGENNAANSGLGLGANSQVNVGDNARPEYGESIFNICSNNTPGMMKRPRAF